MKTYISNDKNVINVTKTAVARCENNCGSHHEDKENNNSKSYKFNIDLGHSGYAWICKLELQV